MLESGENDKMQRRLGGLKIVGKIHMDRHLEPECRLDENRVGTRETQKCACERKSGGHSLNLRRDSRLANVEQERSIMHRHPSRDGQSGRADAAEDGDREVNREFETEKASNSSRRSESLRLGT